MNPISDNMIEYKERKKKASKIVTNTFSEEELDRFVVGGYDIGGYGSHYYTFRLFDINTTSLGKFDFH